MNKDYRDGMVNTCFLLPLEVSAELRKHAIDEHITLQDLLTGLVLSYLYGEE
jgi:hypothetical protein